MPRTYIRLFSARYLARCGDQSQAEPSEQAQRQLGEGLEPVPGVVVEIALRVDADVDRAPWLARRDRREQPMHDLSLARPVEDRRVVVEEMLVADVVLQPQ